MQSDLWVKSYAEKILRFVDVQTSLTTSCTDRIIRRLRSGNESHITNYAILTEERRRELEQRLLTDPSFGEILRKLEVLVDSKRAKS